MADVKESKSEYERRTGARLDRGSGWRHARAAENFLFWTRLMSGFCQRRAVILFYFVMASSQVTPRSDL